MKTNGYELFKLEVGHCFRDAVFFALDNGGLKGNGDTAFYTIVHGKVKGPDGRIFLHAWVNIEPHINGEKMKVWSPNMVDGKMHGVIYDADFWYKAAQPQSECTVENALQLACQTGTWGPWTDEERKVH